jgi:DNA repair protein RadA/Sms
MLLAVLEKRVGLHVGQFDVFVNVAGGVRVDEPAVDLGTAVAIVSSLRDVPVDPAAVAVGEVGLGGEIRTINQIEKRITESKKLGFKRIVVPRRNMKNIHANGEIDVAEVETVEQAIHTLLLPR